MEGPSVAIAFIVREKFGWALAALRRIFKLVDTPFTVYFVDCGYPVVVRREIDAFLAGRTNVVHIAAERFLYPNESLNLVIPRLQEDYLCIIQNDVLIEPGYMSAMLATFDEYACDMVWPMTFELQGSTRKPHRDDFTDTRIREIGGKLLVQVREPLPIVPPPPVRQIQHFELHTLMMTARAANVVWPLPVINTREHIDLAVHAFRRGMTVYANENACASYVLPPIRDYDQAFFQFRWNLNVARRSHVCVARRWNIEQFPNALRWVEHHSAYAAPDRMLRDRPGACEPDIYGAEAPRCR